MILLLLKELPRERLIRYYQSFGFIRGQSIYRQGEVKVVEMSMSIPERQISNTCFSTSDPEDFLYLDEFVYEFENAEYGEYEPDNSET